jgi:hypothetical protein
LETFSDNIDSREELNTQHRFTTLPVLIRLLRRSCLLRTFSTASVIRHCLAAIFRALAARVKRIHIEEEVRNVNNTLRGFRKLIVAVDYDVR